MNRLLILSFVCITLFSCNEAQIDRICEPTLNREFNVIYNAHFKGELQLDLSSSCDTALVYFTEVPPTVVLPGAFQSFQVPTGLQYLVETTCSDSTLTYRYVNNCP
jgi:hypothetical protein